MIAKVVAQRGSRMRGLIEYLWGPGRFNEHERPRMVAGSSHSFIRGEHEPALDSFERKLLAYEMEAPLRMSGEELGEHVYHVPVSLHAGDGTLTDQQWRQVAEEAAESLGLNGGPNQASVPWFAMRHGSSNGEHDHIHFVALTRRETGQQVDFRKDFHTWEQVRHNAEQRWNLTPTRQRGGGVREPHRGELDRAARERRSEPARETLARTVRTAATAARDEADFVHRVRQAQVLIRPRWQRGGQQHAEGYSVALRPAQGQETVWYGGGKLADDLTLTAIRSRWPEPTEQQRAAAAAAWRPVADNEVSPKHVMRVEAWQQAADKTADVRRALSGLDARDETAWASVARDAAGALSALSARTELGERDQLRRAASALGRAAQTSHRGQRPRRSDESRPLAGVVRTATDAMLASQGGPVAAATLVTQLGRLVQTVQTAHRESGRLAQAQRAEHAAGAMLTFVRASPTADRDDPERQHQAQRGPITRHRGPIERSRDERER